MPKIKLQDLIDKKVADLQTRADKLDAITEQYYVPEQYTTDAYTEYRDDIDTDKKAIDAAKDLIDNLENSTASAAQTANIAIRRLNRIKLPDVVALISRLEKLEELSNLRISDLKYIDVDGIRYNIGLSNPHRGTNNKNVKAELTLNEDGTAYCYYPAPLNFTKNHSWRIDQENREFYFDGVVWPYMAWKSNVRI